MPISRDRAHSLFSDTTSSLGRKDEVITVSELNRRARHFLESRFELLWVSGELSNVLRAGSGHWYFSLKDRDAQVRCVMFRNRAQAIGFLPENGQQVEVRALPSVYEARGEFQLGVESMRRAGLGALFEAFEKLKVMLLAEGLFDETRKRVLPFFPAAIGIVTSLKAAALRDVLTTLRRRAPMINVIVYPTAVQGAGSVAEIVAAIDSARLRREVEVLIVCRGGGSIEDLWSFNDESVARAIVRLQQDTSIAVVTGVGHETDFTIADFVADQRAPTPTAAAELASPDVTELQQTLAHKRVILTRAQRRLLDTAAQRLDRAMRALHSPTDRLNRERDQLTLLAARKYHAWTQQLGNARHSTALLLQRLRIRLPNVGEKIAEVQRVRTRLAAACHSGLDTQRVRLQSTTQALLHLDPAQVLARGYSIVEHEGTILRDTAHVRIGDAIQIRLARGSIGAEVKSIK